jgi:hypothetical protein
MHPTTKTKKGDTMTRHTAIGNAEWCREYNEVTKKTIEDTENQFYRSLSLPFSRDTIYFTYLTLENIHDSAVNTTASRR